MNMCSRCEKLPIRAGGLCMPCYQKDYQPDYQRNRYQLRMQEMKDYLGGHCVETICGTTEDLQFDHIDPETKEFSIARYWNRPWSIMVKELDKCQLLCRDCHLDKTRADREAKKARSAN